MLLRSVYRSFNIRIQLPLMRAQVSEDEFIEPGYII